MAFPAKINQPIFPDAMYRQSNPQVNVPDLMTGDPLNSTGNLAVPETFAYLVRCYPEDEKNDSIRICAS